jgi:PPOX class probable FMN-dependent enzyme
MTSSERASVVAMAEVIVDAPFTDTIDTVDQLRLLYRPPTKLVAEKKLDHIAPWGRAMIGAARFVFLATADRDGRTTVSPKGGTPGFVRVLDEHHLAIPDFAGNNLLDSLENIVENPAVGLIFLMPGRPETLRVDGDACITKAPDVLARWADDGRPPKTAIGVRVREVFFHCPASFQRAELWEQGSWDADAPFVEFIRAALPEDEWPSWAAE